MINNLAHQTSITPATPYDLAKIREDFPIFKQKVYGKRLCFLDSGASAQKPLQVMEAMRQSTITDYANIHRGAYAFSENSTFKYEAVRETIRQFIGAASLQEVIIGYNTTSLINLVAHSFPLAFMEKGDEILISPMEHHANIVPWLMAAKLHGLKLVVCPMDDDGNLLLDEFEKRLNKRTKLVAITHVSNVLGTVNPLDKIIPLAHAAGAKILIDGSQAVQHISLNMQKLGADFYVFTGHKLYGPTGIGVLYGKRELLEQMPPFLTGGDMISHVNYEEVSFAALPAKFEAGTPPILESFGIEAAIHYIQAIGLDQIAAHEQALLSEATSRLLAIKGLRIYGQAIQKGPVIAFGLANAHPHDLATLLDQQGIAVRAGLHCAEPLHQRLGIAGTIRVSFGLYNGMDDIDQLEQGLLKAQKMLG